MGKYKVTARARRHVAGIYKYGVLTFGEYQADAYYAGLERTFALLADFPRMAPRVEGAQPEVRSFRFQAHFIVYSEESGHILIRAVMHHAQDWRRKSF